MKREALTGKNFIYLVIAVLLVAAGILTGVVLHKVQNQPCSEAEVILFGDSVVGIVRDETGIASLIGRDIGSEVFNAAFGGTCVARMDSGMKYSESRDPFSLVALTKAMRYRDFTTQNNMLLRGPLIDYFVPTTEALATLDYTKTKIFIIETGINDFLSGVQLESDDPYAEDTFAGAFRASLRNIQKVNPNARIIVVTPNYIWYCAKQLTGEEYDIGYGNQTVYVDKEIEIAKECGVEVLDLYREGYPHDSYEDWSLYTTDGVHPNEAGRILLAQIIADYINGGK